MALPILGEILGTVLGPVKDIVSEVVVDKDKRDEINFKLKQLEDRANERLHEEMAAQITVNNSEAQHRSIFVAGWRPFIGWTGGAGVAWTFVVSPFVEYVSRLFGWTGSMPQLDTGQLMTLVLAMLGVGAMRSYDKKNGTSNDVLPFSPKPSVIDIADSIRATRVEHRQAPLPINPPWVK